MARSKIRDLFEGVSCDNPGISNVLTTGDIRALSHFFSGNKILPPARVEAIQSQLRDLIMISIEEPVDFTDTEWLLFFYNLRALEDKKSMRMKMWIVDAIGAFYGVNASAALGVVEAAPMARPVFEEMKWILRQPLTCSTLNPKERSGHRLKFTTSEITEIVRPKIGKIPVPKDQPSKKPVEMTKALRRLDERTEGYSSFTRIKAVFRNEDGKMGDIGDGLKIQTRFEDGSLGKYLGGIFARRKGSQGPFYEQPTFHANNDGWEPVDFVWEDGTTGNTAEIGYEWHMEAANENPGKNNIVSRIPQPRNPHKTYTTLVKAEGILPEQPRKVKLIPPTWIRLGDDVEMSGMGHSGIIRDAPAIQKLNRVHSPDDFLVTKDTPLEDQLAIIARQEEEIAQLLAAKNGPEDQSAIISRQQAEIAQLKAARGLAKKVPSSEKSFRSRPIPSKEPSLVYRTKSSETELQSPMQPKERRMPRKAPRKTAASSKKGSHKQLVILSGSPNGSQTRWAPYESKPLSTPKEDVEEKPVKETILQALVQEEDNKDVAAPEESTKHHQLGTAKTKPATQKDARAYVLATSPDEEKIITPANLPRHIEATVNNDIVVLAGEPPIKKRGRGRPKKITTVTTIKLEEGEEADLYGDE
ncbi:hypothetical protein GLAREA_03889 [Glarea lozoyensis ATCC 20868]|uniref:Uncharacterized protein n=1 Tax=Glarea lozoyensis (strain ATCC 20868 / MF5171) TaxID=1116229 RepID=S3CX48_GLAL2|nr:uncharacterized protein GLAREA_03889 [Glarea lozoyensis ATCC 20868]EPE30922.1 hypothetical protein GLAREA_03889 [Glarea lozoyensis ATCC 20868]